MFVVYYFEYNGKTGKSVCKVVNRKKCEWQITGKNSTNLVGHLSRLHKEEFKMYEKYENKEMDKIDVSNLYSVQLISV